MNLRGTINYNVLKHDTNKAPRNSPWIFYPVMLFSSLLIVLSIGYYADSQLKNNPQTTALNKDVKRATLYSLPPGTGFTLKNYDAGVQNTTRTSVKAQKKIVCYYNVPSYNKYDLKPSEIHADLCTHINIAFATIKDKKIYASERLFQTVRDVLALKSINTNLKVLLSIGGAGQDKGFSEMVVDHASRKIFIRSVKAILRKHNLDGIDLDWEFPAIQNTSNHRERQHFSQLLREIRSEYIRERRDYLLTLAAAAPQIITDLAYDVDQINMYVDFVNIMTYDFHYYSTYTPFTGLNSPLYNRPEEKYYLSTLNINYTTNMYLAKGLDREKIVVGVPTYGHSFRLVNDDNGAIGSPALGYGTSGSLGFVNYPEICAIFENNSSSVNILYDKYARVPYLQYRHEWISFDDRESVMEKANFIKDNNYGGAMIYSLNADDFLGTCLLKGVHIKFPLSQSLKNVLHN